MNRIDKKFKELKAKRKKAFIAFITAGDPNLAATEKLVKSFEKAGVDIVELGVPFSDPLADGPTIQASSQRALNHHVNIGKIFSLVKRLRKFTQIPIALMTYYNPIYHYGESKFVQYAKRSGVDGIIVPDLPPEEAKALIFESKKENLSTIFFLSPTTTKERVKRIVKASSGFIYYVSLTGVTGVRSGLSQSFKKQVRIAKRYTRTPVCVGFGISSSAHVKAVSKYTDGVIVGSAIINQIVKRKGNRDAVSSVTRFVHQLTKALNNV